MVRLLVGAGAVVTAKQPLLILEAMKMEHVLVASRDGVVEALHCAEGGVVSDGALLVQLAPTNPTAPVK